MFRPGLPEPAEPGQAVVMTAAYITEPARGGGSVFGQGWPGVYGYPDCGGAGGTAEAGRAGRLKAS
jgi:hypothetical protein